MTRHILGEKVHEDLVPLEHNDTLLCYMDGREDIHVAEVLKLPKDRMQLVDLSCPLVLNSVHYQSVFVSAVDQPWNYFDYLIRKKRFFIEIIYCFREGLFSLITFSKIHFLNNFFRFSLSRVFH